MYAHPESGRAGISMSTKKETPLFDEVMMLR